MYTTLETAGSGGVANYHAHHHTYSPTTYTSYPTYARPPAPGYSTDVLGQLYPGYQSQFSYEQISKFLTLC